MEEMKRSLESSDNEVIQSPIQIGLDDMSEELLEQFVPPPRQNTTPNKPLFLQELPVIHINEGIEPPWKSHEEYEALLYYSSQPYISHYKRLFKTGYVKNKTVLVIRCGFGKVALLAQKYGARKVVAIDDRPVWKFFKNVIEKMSLTGIIVENKTAGEVRERFDIIICDWMGINLYYDSLLNEIIKCKRLLRNNGEIIPSIGRCYICGIGGLEYVDEKYDFWKNVYGYDMSILVKNVVCTAYIDYIDESKVITNHCLLYSVNSMTIQEIVKRTVTFKLSLKRPIPLVGFCTYFEADISNHRISTGPGTQTVWRQCCYLCPSPLNKCKIDDVIEGKFKMFQRETNQRWVVIIQYNCEKRGYSGKYQYEF
ncbi:protein arginine N-methyltransferase, putative [Entamoeba dispar SAW760]|uniref:Protein arginine N-methyltransferase, putative n=1 Tax=Entamoeba dispar (strain ATCC PRA-260 / SAW760) TaxID=370354 RepID=B0EBR4_ENTDS|nr:protein arginine N-methyltransferase, putative [Entamoeba dispar SAW760]EDR28076.1 protein arginine N-methyltransferase, putative [Entamoeba dispar SAW760]|eukprot:EDR28076.1 protein arginine N-methyltransferase, putative [Entamoeba dispar SAW760]